MLGLPGPCTHPCTAESLGTRTRPKNGTEGGGATPEAAAETDTARPGAGHLGSPRPQAGSSTAPPLCAYRSTRSDQSTGKPVAIDSCAPTPIITASAPSSSVTSGLAPASAARQSSRAPRRSCRTRGRRAAARAPTLGQSQSNFWASSRSALGALSASSRSSYSAMNFEERRQRRKLTSLSSSCFVPCDGANASSFPRVPTSETSSWCFDASANMHSSSIARAPDWKSTITYALSSTSLSTLLWLTSCPPLAKMRRGSERRMRRMRSKKWTHFSTRVPPVRSLVRFQLPTFFRKGKRCSRIDSMRRSPIRPWSASWISRAIAGMYRYSIPHHSSGAVPPKPPGCLASATVSAQCEMSVQSGFSTRQCLPEARTCRITAWCVSLGVHTSTASTSLSCSISASRSSAITSRTPACCSSASAVCRDGS
mmetsp:Transcript_19808/g.58472  ORF Transcript_19808/g.58472 Transcript_19808/m.58472 type:complete len:425 (+) Transcript_19808:274-1548(+)